MDGGSAPHTSIHFPAAFRETHGRQERDRVRDASDASFGGRAVDRGGPLAPIGLDGLSDGT